MTTKLQEKLDQLLKTRRLTAEKLVKLLEKTGGPWEEARGILKHYKIDAPGYQRKIRREWER